MIDVQAVYDRLDRTNSVLVTMPLPLAAVASSLLSTLFFDDSLADDIEADIDALISQLGGGGMVGMIVAFAFSPPERWIPLDGRQVDASDYPSLAAVWPSFLVLPGGVLQMPDLTGRFLRGGTPGPAAFGGSDSVVLSVANLPPHTHAVTYQAGWPDGPDVDPTGIAAQSGVGETGSVGSGEPVDITPPYADVVWAVWPG